MACEDVRGYYDAPCPKCGGGVRYWYFGPDCRGNPGIKGMQCYSCGRNFSGPWTGLADKPCGKCGGQVECHFEPPGSFSFRYQPPSRMTCLGCGKNFAKKRRSEEDKKRQAEGSDDTGAHDDPEKEMKGMR